MSYESTHLITTSKIDVPFGLSAHLISKLLLPVTFLKPEFSGCVLGKFRDRKM